MSAESYRRSRRAHCAASLDAVLADASLVFPLPGIFGPDVLQPHHTSRSLSLQDSGRSVSPSNNHSLTYSYPLLECLTLIGQALPEKSASAESNFRQIFRLKNLHLLAVFVLVYVGVEVTIGGWIVTYVIDERGGGPSSGYISSGFFAGWSTVMYEEAC